MSVSIIEDRPRAFEDRPLRRIFRPEKEEEIGAWRKLHKPIETFCNW
jgi:hypothetical protein